MTQQDFLVFLIISAKGKIINVSHLFRHATGRAKRYTVYHLLFKHLVAISVIFKPTWDTQIPSKLLAGLPRVLIDFSRA